MPVLSRCATVRPSSAPDRSLNAWTRNPGSAVALVGRPGEGVDAGIVRCERGEGAGPMARGGREDVVMGELLASPPRTPRESPRRLLDGECPVRCDIRGGKATRVAITMPSGP